MLKESRIDDGVRARITLGQRNAAARARREQFNDNRERVLRRVVGEVGVLLGTAVALRVEEFDGGLFGGVLAHWVAVLFLLTFTVLEVLLPDGFFGEALVHARVGEDAEGECREEAFLLVLPEVVGGF